MRMDLPGCDFKYCNYHTDGNCIRFSREQLNAAMVCKYYNLIKEHRER